MAEHEKTFYLYGGKKFSNLDEFAKELIVMDDDAYHHHVTPERNDFANWLRFSLGHSELADHIEGFVPRFHIELHVLRHLVHKQPKVEKKEEHKPVHHVVKVEKKTVHKKH